MVKDLSEINFNIKDFSLFNGQVLSDDLFIRGKVKIKGVLEDIEFEVPALTSHQARKLKALIGGKMSNSLGSLVKIFEDIGDTSDIKNMIGSKSFGMQLIQIIIQVISEILLDEKVAEFIDENIVKRSVKIKVGDNEPFLIGTANIFDDPAYRKFESTIHAKILFQEGKVFMGGQ